VRVGRVSKRGVVWNDFGVCKGGRGE